MALMVAAIGVVLWPSAAPAEAPSARPSAAGD